MLSEEHRGLLESENPFGAHGFLLW